MKQSLLLSWLRSWSIRSYIIHGILIAQMILLPCSSSNGVWVDVDSENNGIFDTEDDKNSPNPSDSEPLSPQPTDPEPSLPPTGDADGDNLSNSDEAAAGSDPYNPDSDYDGLTDSVETNLTGTDPASTDSNSDGVSDYNDFYGNTAVDENVVGPGETPYDYDGDGINDPVDPDPLSPTNDPDSDGDYVPDSQDTDPTNPTEWNDANNNGTNDDAEIPNNDSDGDGISNDTDSHPSDPYLSNDWNYNGGNDQNEDWDGDGVSNLQDSHPNSNCQWCDWNGNGVNDDSESGNADSDGDGYSDNSDSHSYNSSLWEDWNGNGTNDSQESQNNDGDGYPDGSDSDPYNSSLWDDWNRNGTNDSQEPPPVTDRDGDGYNDNSDSDPDYNGLWSDWNRNGANDENETPPQDSDGDGFPDGSDTDPSNSNLWEDNNRNGYNDSNEDQFIDNDQDGRVNAFDSHPNDASLWNDQNSNGQNDENEIIIVDRDGDGYADNLDTHPDDPQRWNDHNNNGSNDELDAPPDSDADGLSDDQDPSPSDSDNDGITNTEEVLNGTNPNNSDTDADGSPDGIEQLTGTNPGNVDTDADGLTDNEEQQAYFTDPLVPNENSFSPVNTPTPSPATDTPPGDAPPETTPPETTPPETTPPETTPPETTPPETTPPEVVPLDPPQLTALILDNQVPGVGIEAAYPILENETVSFPSISADPVNKRDLTKTVFLRNDGTSDLIIESVVVTDFSNINASFSTTPNMTSIGVLMPNEVFSFKVSFNAISAWAKISQSASLIISYSQPGSAAASSTIPGLLYCPPSSLGFVIRLETLVPAGIWQTEGGHFSADLRDTDGDGIPDLVEQMYLPLVVTSHGDLDGDGVNNLTQYRAGRDLLNEANVSDVDKDGLDNQVEEAWAKVYPGMISKYKFEDAYVDPDQDGLLTIEELNCTWGSATVKDPAAVATNPFLKSTGPNNAGGTAALKSALSYKLTSRTVPTNTTDPKLKWSWREASPNYAAWMNDGLLRLAYRASAQNGVYPADFFTRRYSSAAPAALAEVSGFDHLPLGHLRWLKDVALKNVAFGNTGISIPPVTSSIDGSLPSLSLDQSAEIKTKLSTATAKDLGSVNPDDLDADSMPNAWEARYQLDWRKASDASQPKVKETVAARTAALVLTTAQKSGLKPENQTLSSENAILAVLIEKSLDDSSSPHDLPASVAPALRQTRLISEYPLDAKVPAALSAPPAPTATPLIKNAWEAKRIIWRDQFVAYQTQGYLEEIDPDHDGLVNADEYRLGLNPNLADYTATGSLRDTDGDGFSDAIELATGTDSRNATKKPKLVVSIAPLDGPQGRPFETLPSPLIIRSFYRGDKGVTLIAPSATINLTAPDTFTLLAPLAAEQSVTTIAKEAWYPKTLQITTDSNGIGRVGVKLPHLKGSINVTCTASVGTILSVAASCSLSVSPLLSDTDGDGMPDAWEAQIALTIPLNLPAHKLLKTSALDAIESPLHYGYHRDTPRSALPVTPVNIAAELASLRQGGRLITPTSLTSIQGLTAARKTFLEGILKKIDPDNDGLSNLEEYEQRATGLTHPQIGSTPHITIQPKNGYAFSGGQAKLSVAAVTGDGRSPKYFQYQWYHGTANNESNRVSTSTSPDLLVTAPIISGYKSPSYWVKILCDDSTVGDPPNAATIRSVNSTTATVEAMTTIEITREPTLPTKLKIDAKDQLVIEATGGTATLKLSFQWYSGNSGDTSNPLSNAVPATFANGKYISKYTPPKLPPGDHSFWARVTNPVGLSKNSQAATSHVPASPVITQQPSDTVARISAAGTMEVIATSKLTLSYQWYSYVPVKNEPPVYQKFTSFSAQSPIFTVPDFNEPRNFYILVQVTDELGNMTESEPACYEVISSETMPIIQREPNISFWKLPDDSFNFLVQAVGFVDEPQYVIGIGENKINTTALQYQWYLGERGDTRSPITGASSNTINIPKSDTMPEKIWVDIHNYLRIRIPGLPGRPDTYVNHIQSAKSETVNSAQIVGDGDSPFRLGPPSGNPNPQPNPPFELKLVFANVNAYRYKGANGKPEATAGYVQTYLGGGKIKHRIDYKGALSNIDKGPPLPDGIQTMINSCSVPFTSFFTNDDFSSQTGLFYTDSDWSLYWGLASSAIDTKNRMHSEAWSYNRPQLAATDPNAPTGVFTPIELPQGTKKTYLIQKTVYSIPPQVSIVGSHTFEIAVGQAFAEAFPEDKARNMGFFDAVTDGGAAVIYNPLPIDLAIDANRDGTIASGETASQAKPFRFWVNNDSDPNTINDDVEDAMKEDEASPPDALDWKTPTASPNGEIDGVRDLEDFTRLHLTLPDDIIQKAEAGEAQIGFKWVDGNGPRVRVYKAADDAGGLEYLTSPQKANEQCSGGYHQSVADVKGTAVVYLPSSYWQSTSSQGSKRCFLFEGCEEGTARLATVIKLGSSQEVAAPGPWIKIMDVRRMFERAKVAAPYAEPDDIPDAWVTGDDPDPVLTHTSDPWGFPFEADPDEAKQYIVHVHGWRMDYPEIQTWAQTTFKRLWHHGYKGRFAAFRWPTFSAKTDLLAELNPIDGRLTYNDSEYRAWLSGVALAGYVNSLPSGYTKNIMAHSMGNVVTGAAFRAGMSGMSRYVMFNSAMAHMAYGTTNREFSDRITPDTDTDPQTREMGLANKFLTMVPTTNFYLAPDFAVSVWEVNHAVNKPESIPTFFTERYWSYFPNFPNNIWGDNLITPPNQLNSEGRKIWYKIQTGNASGPGLSLTGGRVITKIPEAMAYVTQSRSKPAGNSNITGGSVQSSVSLDGYGFGSEHSAEWVYSIQKTFECYTRLLKQFGIEPYPN